MGSFFCFHLYLFNAVMEVKAIKYLECCAEWANCCPGKSKQFTSSPAYVSSAIMALAGMGDAFLYAYLPVYGNGLGLSAFVIGMLLSVNKFSRFFFNRWVAVAAADFGAKRVLIFAILSAAITTTAYGFNLPPWAWICIRILWGASFAAFRLATTQYAMLSSTAAHALGNGRAIQEFGPLLAYWIGPMLFSLFGLTINFYCWGILTGITLVLALKLPVFKIPGATFSAFKFQKANWLDVWVFCAAFIVEGLLVVGASNLLLMQPFYFKDLLLITALLISLRRILQIICSPLAGYWVNRFGYYTVFKVSAIVLLLSLLILASPASWVGMMLAFLAAAFYNTAIPLFALTDDKVNIYGKITRISTSRDLGAAMGALTGIWLITSFDHLILFFFLFLCHAIIFIRTIKFVKHHA